MGMQQNGGFGVCLHTENQLGTRSSAVKISLSLVIGYLPFRYVRASLYTTWAHRCPMSCVRSAQKFSGKENKKNNNMERQNGVRAPYVTFLLRAHRAGFGCVIVLNTLEEAYLWTSTVLRRRRLASFAEAH